MFRKDLQNYMRSPLVTFAIITAACAIGLSFFELNTYHTPVNAIEHSKPEQAKARKRKPKKRKIKKNKKLIQYHHRETAARHWISWTESRNQWNIDNGTCYGKYQLNYSYLHGNYSHYNQRKVAENYVHHRYGTWQNAKVFHVSHGWY